MAIKLTLNEIKNRAAKTRQSFRDERDRIKQDSDLNDQAKQRKINELRQAASDRIGQLKSDYYSGLETRKSELKTSLFAQGHKFGASEGDKAAGQMSYRDAIDRAGAAKTRGDLERMHSRAQTTGDNTLIRAISLVAKEKGYADLSRSIVGESNHEDFDELHTLENLTPEQKMRDSSYFTQVD